MRKHLLFIGIVAIIIFGTARYIEFSSTAQLESDVYPNGSRLSDILSSNRDEAYSKAIAKRTFRYARLYAHR